MEYQEAKDKFIESWGALGSSWGINKAMAQIHALLLISDKPLSAEEIMKELNMSRGNVNMNIRGLIDWGIVEKKLIPGERKEFFISNKDIYELSRQVARERSKREIEPVLKVLNEVQAVKGNSTEIKEFKQVTKEISDYTNKLKRILDRFMQSDKTWFHVLLMKLIK